ncbi:sodium-dependent tyrosine transporter [Malaciobacter mytili]|uniref:Sodium-dependent tyrosine transporter n=1 Tax=Malaciobacter mytili LMG 24559 TaxID=1032238 RepID=A0AAX2ALP5_9BACT|nr:sodium-dependent tyrosine transporter [Malaciobacter mytili]AXH14720.1 hypothetical protein AMYT_1134 [Malaciobacter mytili LMG 24559]RXI48322.1 sodium-dependent tyrosine transporter [Malaciobacter mytili]RXK16906.1 sodium-dependent tyrosine transporter [Malaciobacter mytili LMG 24559]
MFVKLNDRVYLNMAKITRMKIDHVEDGIRVRFYEGQEQVAKSKRFDDVQAAEAWLQELLSKI